MEQKLIPNIGVTLDWRSSGGYSLYPWYAMRQNYCDRLAEQGAMPLLLPYHRDLVESYLDQLDGLLITGGDFDVHPSLYNEEVKHERVETLEDRTYFEYDLTKGALKRNMPILGICGGHQLLNVALGGALIQHIPAEVKTQIEHEQPNPRTEPGHEVFVVEKTKLADIVESKNLSVNSAHHQAIKKIGDNVIVNAISTDDLIEGIEVANHSFCMGIQWHPEYLVSSGDKKIFGAFIEACRSYSAAK